MTYEDCYAFEGGACAVLYRMPCKGCGLYRTIAEMEENWKEETIPEELWEYVAESRIGKDEI